MKSINLILFLFLLTVKINHIASQKKNINYKCGVDKYFYNNMIGIDPEPIDPRSPLYRRRLKEVDEDGFKNFYIYVDMTNLKKDIESYNLQSYEDCFINSINKAVETLQKLLK